MSKYSVTLRFSLNADHKSAVRNSVASTLETNGFTNTGTGTWNSGELTATQVSSAITTVTGILGNAGQNNSATQLDHYWVNVDRLPD